MFIWSSDWTNTTAKKYTGGIQRTAVTIFVARIAKSSGSYIKIYIRFLIFILEQTVLAQVFEPPDNKTDLSVWDRFIIDSYSPFVQSNSDQWILFNQSDKLICWINYLSQPLNRYNHMSCPNHIQQHTLIHLWINKTTTYTCPFVNIYDKSTHFSLKIQIINNLSTSNFNDHIRVFFFAYIAMEE